MFSGGTRLMSRPLRRFGAPVSALEHDPEKWEPVSEEITLH
jgi:hypothetical protein